jgi:hypothetical protein
MTELKPDYAMSLARDSSCPAGQKPPDTSLASQALPFL